MNRLFGRKSIPYLSFYLQDVESEIAVHGASVEVSNLPQAIFSLSEVLHSVFNGSFTLTESDIAKKRLSLCLKSQSFLDFLPLKPLRRCLIRRLAEKFSLQESLQVGCIPLACWPYVGGHGTRDPRPPPPCGKNDWQTPMKTSPSCNFVGRQ